MQNKYLFSFEFPRLQSPVIEVDTASEGDKQELTEAKTSSSDDVSKDADQKNEDKAVLVENEDEKKKNMEVVALEKELTKVSLEADTFATRYLSLFIFPLVIGFIIYSLIFRKYKSWYSWGISSLTSCVYTFGFILMCPQLYINHQLKSVSYLPWQVSLPFIRFFFFNPFFAFLSILVFIQYLIYKFINTFIDGKFCSIVKFEVFCSYCLFFF
jgi:hypothetical protein